MMMVDGDSRRPSALAQELGFVGAALTKDDLQAAVLEILAKNKDIVSKIKKTGKMGPVMALVGQVMQHLNKRGDPVCIKDLIETELKK